MNTSPSNETITCPYCNSSDHSPWGSERGFVVVRCSECRFLYVNPRPRREAITAAVMTGSHANLSVVSKRNPSKVTKYKTIISDLFGDVLGQRLSWLDVGAGYGEVLEAVISLAPNSLVTGLEPMQQKAAVARNRGLNIEDDYLRPGRDRVSVISAIDVFSHIPDFASFLSDVRSVLIPGGLLFIETGNMADFERKDFPGELYLPDHLVFAGEAHIRGFLERGGFSIEKIEKRRIDGFTYCAKSIAKHFLGRPSVVRIPFTSGYRTLLIRARSING